MSRLHAMLAFMLVIGMAVNCLAVGTAVAAPATSITVNQNSSYATLSVSPYSGGEVRWDFDDGTYGSGVSTGHRWEPGLYKVRAVIIPSTGEPHVLERHIGVYSDGPVREINRNEEYRYAIYNGPEPLLTVTDSDGRLVSWLEYDAAHRIVTGVPRDVGTYHAILSGDRTIEWTINVSDGPLQAPWVRFASHAADGEIIIDSLHAAVNDAIARYTWALSDLTGPRWESARAGYRAYRLPPGYISCLFESKVSAVAPRTHS